MKATSTAMLGSIATRSAWEGREVAMGHYSNQHFRRKYGDAPSRDGHEQSPAFRVGLP